MLIHQVGAATLNCMAGSHMFRLAMVEAAKTPGVVTMVPHGLCEIGCPLLRGSAGGAEARRLATWEIGSAG